MARIPPMPEDLISSLTTPELLAAFDGVDFADARAAMRYGWRMAHKTPGRAAALVRSTPERPLLAAQAAGARAALDAQTRCRRCGRVLEDTVSVERGVGPDCWAKGAR